MTSAELPDLSDMSRADWGYALHEFVEGVGDYLELDEDHHVIQVGDGDKLIVTFESAHDIRNSQENALPYGLRLAQDIGASVISILCLKPTWFRAKPVFDFFDALTDEGIFDSYDRVLFYGAGLGGYGACAFAVAAPGCDVLAISPQATLDPRVTEWDPRFASTRRRSFNDRYGFAPDMVEAAQHAMILYNPDDDLEAMHSALFARPGVTRFRCRHLGRDLPSALDEMEILGETVRLALRGKLGMEAFAKLYRARRDYGPYLRTLLTEVEDHDRPKLIEWLATNVLKRRTMPRMRRALDRVTGVKESTAAE
ncbi:MAG: phosphoadenosine phosphosulfate reductase [Pseudomonadota bacterium]